MQYDFFSFVTTVKATMLKLQFQVDFLNHHINRSRIYEVLLHFQGLILDSKLADRLFHSVSDSEE